MPPQALSATRSLRNPRAAVHWGLVFVPPRLPGGTNSPRPVAGSVASQAG